MIFPVQWPIVRKGVSLGLAAFLLAVLTFWATFFVVFLASTALHWLLVPPNLQTFQVPLDYDPFRLVDRNHKLPLYQLRNPPSIFRKSFALTNPKPTFNEDDPLFYAANTPYAAVGFTDLALNASGLIVDPPKTSRRWWIPQPVRAVGRLLGFGALPRTSLTPLDQFPLEIILSFDHNSQGFCASIEDPLAECHPNELGWFETPNQKPIDVRAVFYAGSGEALLETAVAFFPNKPHGSRAQELTTTIMSTALQCCFFMTPWFLRLFSGAHPGGGWEASRISLFENVVLRELSPRAPLRKARFVKVRVSPRLPMQKVQVVFQAQAKGLASWLQRYPRLLSVGTAFVIASIVSAAVAALGVIVCSIYLIHAAAFDGPQPSERKRD